MAVLVRVFLKDYVRLSRFILGAAPIFGCYGPLIPVGHAASSLCIYFTPDRSAINRSEEGGAALVWICA